MKKKLIQILMLLVVAVSIGAFVSCKDTNEDLYNEVRNEVNEIKDETADASLAARLAELEKKLQEQIDLYQSAAGNLGNCKCEPRLTNLETIIQNMQAGGGGSNITISGSGGSGSGTSAGQKTLDDVLGDIDDLLDDNGQFNSIIDLINGNSASIANILITLSQQGVDLSNLISRLTQDESNINKNAADIITILNLISGHTTDISNIQTLLTEHGSNISILQSNQQTAQTLLNQTIADLQALQTQVDNIKQCNCDFTTLWTAINTLETRMSAVETLAQSAMNLATTANTTANTANTNANTALTTANSAALTAAEAKTAADAATTIANLATQAAADAAAAAATAEQKATAAGLTADEAKAIANTAKTNAETALTTANDAIALATQLQTAVTNNTNNITALQNDIQTIQNTLNTYGQQISKNADDIATNTAAIATNVANIQKNAQDIQQNKDDIAALNTQITTLSTDVANALQKAQDAYAQATVNAAAIEGLKTDVSANTNAITALQGLTTTLQTDLTNLTSQVTTNTNNITNLTTNVTNLTNTVNNLTSTVTNLSSTVTNMQTTLTDHETRLTNMEAELTTIKSECAANLLLAKQYAEQQAEAVRTALMTEINNLIAQLANYYTKDQVYTKQEVDDLLTQLQNNLTISINGNTVRIEGLEGRVTILEGKVVNLENAVDDHGTRITALETRLGGYETLVTTVDGHTNAITKLQTDLSALSSTVDGLSSTVNDHTTAIEAIEAALAAIKSCTCDPEKITNLESQIADILTRLATAEGNISNNTTAIGQNADAIAANTILINNIKTELTTLINQQIENLQNDLESKINTVDGRVDDLNDSIAALQLAFDNLNYITPELVDQKLADLAQAMLDKVKADSLVSALADENLKKRMDIIGDSVSTAFADIIAIQTQLAGLDAIYVKTTDFEDFKSAYAASKDSILNRISTNETNISDLQKAVQAVNDSISSLREDITKLEKRMDTAEEYLAQAMQDIQDIKSEVAAIQDYLAKQVTSIKIQATNNPWFGRISTPVDVSTNILLAFYGLPTDKVEFPTSSSRNYVRASEALTAKDMEMLSGLKQFKSFANIPLMYEDGYAGKIYMTINPNTADVSGLAPKIVNSLDEESYISLDGVQPSTEKLQFGWTRADQSSNGFYEARAIVKPADVQKINSPSFNTPAIKDAIQNAKEAITQMAQTRSLEGNGGKLEKIASDINTIVNGLRFDQSGLKVSYTSKDATGVEQTHSVYSDYNLAATAFQPLSLATLKDLNIESIPGYQRANSLLDRISNTLNDKVHTFFKDFNNNGLISMLSNFKVDSIKIPSLSDDLLAKFELHMDTVFIMGGLEYHFSMPIDVEIPVRFEKELSIPVNMEGVVVNVPVHIEKDVEIDLSDISITTPTVVVKGTFTGTPNDVKDSNGNPVTSLLIPVKNDAGEITGYTEIPLDNLKVSVDVEAQNDNAGTSIYLNGDNPVAKVVIDTTFTSTVDIHQTVTYKLVIEDTFTKHIDISKYIQLGYVDYLRDPNEQDGYAKDENGNLIPLKDENGNPIPGDKRGFILRFNYDMRDAAQELWGMAEDALNGINGGLLKDLQDLVAEVNNMLKQINNYEKTITSTVDNFVDKIKDFLDKINSVGTKIINSTNSRFQPFMAASTSKGMKRLSGSRHYPTVLSSDVTFVPTSQTLELFVPIARKHVAVTNVFNGTASAQNGNSDCIAKLRAVNTGQFNTVLDGTVRKLNTSNFVSGYVYEIAYSALDFHGKIATRKYYITVQ